MATITLNHATKRYGSVEAVRDISFEMPSGGFTVIVGPSGCGKSTLLRMIAGLEDITEGDLMLEGDRLNDVDAAERGMAMVFQSYALYPHMTVRQNMSFSLRIVGLKKPEIEETVRKAAASLQIEHLLDRKPRELSGGQRQRVAIGRAIVRDPKVFLFDEPLSNLDADLRVQMRVELARLHERLGNTMVYVTHDQVEAMTLATQIVVMRHGHVEQIGTPNVLYEDPANLFVSTFIGTPRTNVLRGTITQEGRVRLDAGPELTPPLSRDGLAAGDEVSVTIRPELIDRDDLGAPDFELEGNVDVVENLGGLVNVHLTLKSGEPLVVQRRHGAEVRIGSRQTARIRLVDLRLFDREGARLR